jgi:DNA-binding transcriptional regulator YiaG
MDANEFRAAYETLELTQNEVARMFCIEQRTVRRWASDQQDVPNSVAVFLRYMVHEEVQPEDVMKHAANRIFTPKPTGSSWDDV